MMTGLAPVQLSATSVATTQEFEGNSKRRYFAAYCADDFTITIDGVTFTVAGGTPFAPVPAPTNNITVAVTAGPVTVLEG